MNRPSMHHPWPARRLALALALLPFAAPGLAQASWQLVPTPGACVRPALVYDPVRQVSVLFGGASGTVRSETWEWDGNAWHQRAVAGPQLGVVFGGVYDPLRQQVVVFGTPAPLTALQVWGFDGASWTQHASPSTAPVQNVAMVWDAGRGRIVVNAEVPSQSFWRNWEWYDSAWHQGAVMAALWSAADGQMAYDPVRGVCVMNRFGETQTYSGGEWQVAHYFAGFVPYRGYSLTWDPRRQALVMIGGGQTRTGDFVFVWSGSSWVFDPVRFPDLREYHGACFHAATNCMLVVGGRRRVDFNSDFEIAVGTFTDAGGTWTRRDALHPEPSEAPGLCHDAARDRLVLFGGRSTAALNRHFEWDPTGGWSECTFATRPAPRSRHRMVFDPTRAQTVLFGGLDAAPFGDTWLFDGTSWLQAATGAAPTPRYEPAMTFDEDRQVVVLYGGRDGGNTFRDTWEWNGVQWQQRVVSFPPAEARSALAFDPRRHRCVLVNSGAPGQIVVWLWDGANWTSQAPPSPWPTLTVTSLFYDRARGRLVLSGSTPGGGETWDEALGSWTLRTTEPGIDRDGAFAYDGGRGRTLFFGGKTATGLVVADSWQFASQTPASYDAYGAGCPGPLGVPALAADGSPWLGDTLTVRVDSVPATALAVIESGFSASTHQGIPLPFDLGALGYPGCLVLASPEIATLGAGAPAAVRTMALVIPNVAAFTGTELFQQALVFDPATQQLFASNGRRARLGIR